MDEEFYRQRDSDNWLLKYHVTDPDSDTWALNEFDKVYSDCQCTYRRFVDGTSSSFAARRYASAVYAVIFSERPSVCHKSEFHQNS